jgi:DNA-binding winged helix-turn-helix (wHTH) protein
MTNRLLEIIEERQVLYERLVALDREEKEILTGKVRTDEECVDFSMFRDTTSRLLTAFWNAPDKMLSHEDIRQDVLFDPEASDCNVRRVINRARKALQEKNFGYEIRNIKGKGYHFFRNATLPQASQTLPNPQKSREITKQKRER